MEAVTSTLSAAAAFVGWKALVFLVLGMWLGDWAGRKFPRAWSWLRLGLKNAGDAVQDQLKG